MDRFIKIVGKVIHGKGKGKTVGMPTANIEYKKNENIIENFVYASIVLVENKKYIGVTNIGERPSVDDEKNITVETHILDFDYDIYGVEITIYLIEKIRETKKFSSLNEVKLQVDNDKIKAKEICNKYL